MALIDKLTAIGDAIRAKKGTTGAIPLANMPAEIASIPTGTNVSDTTAVASNVLKGKYFYTSAGVKTQGSMVNQGFGSFIVDSTDVVTIPAGYYTGGYINILDEDAENLIPENIKEGVTILGVEGELSGGGLPTNIASFKAGTAMFATNFSSSSPKTINHNMGQIPDLIMFWHNGNIAQTQTMLWSLWSSQIEYRSGNDVIYSYHSTSATSLTTGWTSTYGLVAGVFSNITDSSFTIGTLQTSTYWRAGEYNWIAIKFANDDLIM